MSDANKKAYRETMKGLSKEQRDFVKQATETQRATLRAQQMEIAKKLAQQSAQQQQAPAQPTEQAPVSHKQVWEQLRATQGDRVAAGYYQAHMHAIDAETFGGGR